MPILFGPTEGLDPHHALDRVREDTVKVWNRRLTDTNRPTIALDWTTGTAVDGALLLSGRVDGPYAEGALLRFVRQGGFVLDQSGPCQEPVFDYSLPGRTACIWRTGGVWVELWHDDPVVPAPTPTPALHAAQTARTAPGARLPFARLRNALTNAKEQSA